MTALKYGTVKFSSSDHNITVKVYFVCAYVTL